MSHLEKIIPAHAMATPWRRRRLCTLAIGGESSIVALRSISGSGARVDTTLVPMTGTIVELHHPDAGIMQGRVNSIDADGIGIGFDGGETAVSFALNAIIADMTA
jgi:hypothetical protein